MSKKYEHLIFKNIEENIGLIPYHTDQLCIQRLVPKKFPLHIALHYVSKIENIPQKYVSPHTHDVPEVNIFVPMSEDFMYEVELEDEIYNISGHNTIWIPENIKHSANVKSGKGYFICIILDNTLNVFGID
jgi:hypothetical protein